MQASVIAKAEKNQQRNEKKQKNQKTPDAVFNTVFINPDIYFKGTRQHDTERLKNERLSFLSIFLKAFRVKLGNSLSSLGHSVPTREFPGQFRTFCANNYFKGTRQHDTERLKNERLSFLSIFLKAFRVKLGNSLSSLGHSVPTREFPGQFRTFCANICLDL